eukprot:gene14574-5647_t
MQRAIHEHPLVKVDPNVVYQQYHGRWTCDGCQNSQGNTRMPYHCATCNYDVCDECFQGHRHLRHQHPLYRMDMARVYPEFQGGWKCDHCGRNKQQLQQTHGYHCPLDQFDLCHECFHGKRHQIHVHTLKPADSIIMYGESTGLWLCDSCCLSGSEIGSRFPWHCAECDFDACDYCMKEYDFPFHHHPLTITDSRLSYNDFNGRWTCDVCHSSGGQGINGRDKSFHCSTCRYDVCLYCVKNLTNWPRGNFGTDVPCPNPPITQQQIPLPEFRPEDDQEEPDESQRCDICLVRRKNATIVHGNTGHICCCMRCAWILKTKGEKCPICRAKIDNVIRHFTS